MEVRTHQIYLFRSQIQDISRSLFILPGFRLQAPDGTPDEIYHLMLRCWDYEPDKRPHFDQIYSVIDNLLQAYKLSQV